MRRFAFLSFAAATSAALACGYCVEDKIAGVYDHAAVSKAIAQKHVVVFFALEGRLRPGEPERRRIASVARSVPGVDPVSVRLSMELAALALAYDPGRTTLARLENALARKLAPIGLTLLNMRMMDSPGDLAAAPRPARALR